MHWGEFNSVETELREIEEEFASGRMNAFGTAATKENFVRELRKIADIETQVFYKTCGLLSASIAEDHLMRAMLFATVDPSGPSAGTVSNSDECSTTMGTTRSLAKDNRDADNGNGHNSGGNANGKVGRNETGAGDERGSPASPDGRFGPNVSPETREGGAGAAGFSDAELPPWGGDAGFSDRPFLDVSRHFKMLEGEFTAIGENLRQVSKHVLRLNDIAERVRNRDLDLGS